MEKKIIKLLKKGKNELEEEELSLSWLTVNVVTNFNVLWQASNHTANSKNPNASLLSLQVFKTFSESRTARCKTGNSLVVNWRHVFIHKFFNTFIRDSWSFFKLLMMLNSWFEWQLEQTWGFFDVNSFLGGLRFFWGASEVLSSLTS